MKQLDKPIAAFAIAVVFCSAARYAFANATHDPWLERYEPTKLEWLVLRLSATSIECNLQKCVAATWYDDSRSNPIYPLNVQVLAPDNMDQRRRKLLIAAEVSRMEFESSALKLEPPRTTVDISASDLRGHTRLECDFTANPTGLQQLGNGWETSFDSVCHTKWNRSW